MRVWAITGGIASGKSAVSRFFAEEGAQLASADEDARAVLTDGSGTREAVLAAFGTVDRATLAARIFHDPEARKTLNGIMHPAIRQRMRAALQAAQADPAPGLFLYEVPLLYEGGLETWFEGVIVALATPELQRTRLLARGLSEGEALARIRAQLSPEEKARRADLVIRTDLSEAQTRAAVRQAYQSLMGLESAKTPI